MRSTAFVLAAAISVVTAANDWSQPCHAGVCSYDLPATGGKASGTLKIWGSKNAISDITPAAGWEILGCSSNVLAQEIRLVCNNKDGDCSHLYQIGAEGKIVRLPENCGKSAFARVARAWVHNDQSISADIASRIATTDGSKPQVKALYIDTNFPLANWAKFGPVNFAIRAANIPGASGDLVTTPPVSQRRSRINDRGFFDFIGNSLDAIASLSAETLNKTLTPFDFNQKLNLFNQSLTCPPVEAQVSIDMEAKAHADVTIGVAASGTITPPTVSELAFITSMTADLDGIISMKGGATGAIDSGKIKLYEVGIPGLDFPGVLTLGPSFRIDAQAKATLATGVDMSVGIHYHVDKVQLVFPPNKKAASGGTFQVGDTPLTVSVSPSAKATGTVEAHLIPSLNLGITALNGAAEAKVSLELDASSSMKLDLGATSKTILSLNPPAPSSATSVPAPIPSTVAAFNGCFGIGAGFNVNAGASAAFFGIFNPNVKLPLLSKNFEVFKKCFGTSTGKRSDTDVWNYMSVDPASTLKDRALALTCPVLGTLPLLPIADQTIPAIGLKTL